MSQHIHILGICGTFMGSLAILAKQAGYRVTGCDSEVYPPMSTQLEAAGVELTEGFGEHQLTINADTYVVGNVVSRGNDLMEAILDRGLPFLSGPQWFSEHILRGKWVLGVSGTHGKTTTTSILSWILEYAGMKPGFLIGGVAENFGVSARLGQSDFFVVEADEYDTAFFDKRSKFVHYRPKTLIINNLEFDHADIFPDLQAIQRQFHHLVRTVPRIGMIVRPMQSAAIDDVLERGVWSELQGSTVVGEENDVMSSDWRADSISEGETMQCFDVLFRGARVAAVSWNLTGLHSVQNALHAIAAARHIGVTPEVSAEALSHFKGVKRRMELKGKVKFGSEGEHVISVYDDFAHHPTAIETTLAGLRKKVASASIMAVIEPRSNTMRMGVHKQALLASTADADHVYWFDPAEMAWSLKTTVNRIDGSSQVFTEYEDLVQAVCDSAKAGAHIVVMSNGGFAAMPQRILEALRKKYGKNV